MTTDDSTRDTTAHDLPAGWGPWTDDNCSLSLLYAPGASRVHGAFHAEAFNDGTWTTYHDGGTVEADRGSATPRDGETLLAAAQRCAVEALWACDGFGVGEVRGVVLPRHVDFTIGGAATVELPGLSGRWSVTRARFEGDATVIDARRVDARPGGDVCLACGSADLVGIGCGSCGWTGEPIATPESEGTGASVEPLSMPCQGCGEDITEGAHHFERVADGCPFCPACAAENAAGDDPDEMRTGEWVEASSADPLLPADHPLATRPRRDDAVGLVHAPFVPSAKAAAETVAEMARVSEARDADELERLLLPLPILCAAASTGTMPPGGLRNLARAAELLDRERDRLTKRAVASEECADEWVNRHAEGIKTIATLRARVAELEAAGRVTASLAKDFAAQATAEQSIRNWLRAHGHDLARPWDEVVIGLLAAPTTGHKRCDNCREFGTMVDESGRLVYLWGAGDRKQAATVRWSAQIAETILERQGKAAPTGHAVAGLLERVEEARNKARDGERVMGKGDPDGDTFSCVADAYEDAARMIRDTLGTTSPLDAVVAAVLAMDPPASKNVVDIMRTAARFANCAADGDTPAKDRRALLKSVARSVLACIEIDASDTANGGA